MTSLAIIAPSSWKFWCLMSKVILYLMHICLYNLTKLRESRPLYRLYYPAHCGETLVLPKKIIKNAIVITCTITSSDFRFLVSLVPDGHCYIIAFQQQLAYRQKYWMVSKLPDSYNCGGACVRPDNYTKNRYLLIVVACQHKHLRQPS